MALVKYSNTWRLKDADDVSSSQAHARTLNQRRHRHHRDHAHSLIVSVTQVKLTWGPNSLILLMPNIGNPSFLMLKFNEKVNGCLPIDAEAWNTQSHESRLESDRHCLTFVSVSHRHTVSVTRTSVSPIE